MDNQDPPTILITGATGNLGRAVVRELQNDFNVIGTGFSRASKYNCYSLDITSQKDVNYFVKNHKPKFIIHTAAERRPDVFDQNPTQANTLNISATQYLIDVARETESYVIYISTDYVFDGDDPPYSTEDEPNPLNAYGKSKLQGEKPVLEYDKGIVLRVPVLYGYVESLEETVVTGLIKMVITNEEKIVDDYNRRFPTFCDDVATVIKQMISKELSTGKTIRGIYHWGGNEEMSKYDMCIAIANILGKDVSHLKPNPNPPNTGAKRPYNTQLDCSKLEKLNIGARTPFKKAMRSVLNSIKFE